MKFCTHCGKELLDEAIFCPGCGCEAPKHQTVQAVQTGTKKFCSYCGAEVLPQAVVCPKCGCAINKQEVTKNKSGKAKALQGTAKAFMFVSVGFCILYAIIMAVVSIYFNYLGDSVTLLEGYMEGYPEYLDYVDSCKLMSVIYLVLGFVFLLPLIWITIMIKHYFKATRNQEPVGVGFKVCTLIFVSLVAGILMLCDTSGKKKQL